MFGKLSSLQLEKQLVAIFRKGGSELFVFDPLDGKSSFGGEVLWVSVIVDIMYVTSSFPITIKVILMVKIDELKLISNFF